MIEIFAPTDELADALAELQRRMTNLRPVMRSIGTELESRIASRFETRTDPAGIEWLEWSPAYRASYPEDGRGQLLQRYGDLVNSLNYKADAESVRVGFGRIYGTYHEFGTKHMPRRGLLFANPKSGELGEGDEKAINDLLQDWLDGVFD